MVEIIDSPNNTPTTSRKRKSTTPNSGNKKTKKSSETELSEERPTVCPICAIAFNDTIRWNRYNIETHIRWQVATQI
jgi:hypothetical protein